MQPLSCSQAINGVNAFDLMRQSQLRAASRCHTFFLERTAEGAWLGHCWAKGCATPAQQRLAGTSCWSVTLTVGSSAGGSGRGDAAATRETVVLLTNVPPMHGGIISWSSGGLPSNDLPPEGRWRGGPSALKSALQKAVRLGRGACAVRAALHLVKEEGGPAQLLRRLSVVCVEDAILHPGLPLVVWLMAAQAKGFVLGCTHVEALLALTYQLAMVQVRDGLPDAWDGGESAAPGAAAQVDELALPAAEGCLVKCLLFRASYGGMGGDVRMMRAFAGYWAARFKGTAAAPPSPAGTTSEAGGGSQPWSGSSAANTSAATAAAATSGDASPKQPSPALGAALGRPCRQPQQRVSAPGVSDPVADDRAAQRAHGPADTQRSQLQACAAAGSPPGTHRQGLHDGALVSQPGSCRKRGCAEVLANGASQRATAAESARIAAPADPGLSGLPGENGGASGTAAAGDAPAAGLHGDGHSGGVFTSDEGCIEAGAASVAEGTCAPVTIQQAAAAQCSGPGPGSKERPPAPPSEEGQRSRLLTPITAHQPQRPGAADCVAHSGAGDQDRSQSGDSCSAAGSESRFVDAGRRISDAYFAAKLQAEDAPPSCGAFVSASQLLAEAISEQRSLHNVVVVASANRTLTQPQPQSQWRRSSQAVREGLTQLQATQQQPAQQQQHQTAPGVVRPRWHPSCSATAATRLGDGPEDAEADVEHSPWLAYLCDLYNQVPVPVTLAAAAAVGPLRRSDVPLSAVDFHVSDVVTRLMERQEVVAAAPGGATGAPEDAEDALKSAMWLFRSSKNPKAWVHRLSPCCLRSPEGLQPCEEHRSLEEQLQREDGSRRRLAALWSAAATWADRFSVGYIARRFGPP